MNPSINLLGYSIYEISDKKPPAEHPSSATRPSFMKNSPLSISPEGEHGIIAIGKYLFFTQNWQFLCQTSQSI
jgi:hypothetical protein